MKKRILLGLIVPTLYGTMSFAQSLYVDHSKQGATVPETLYGIFFEEISHAGDGGLYGELIQNRGFEEHVLPSGTTLKGDKAYCPSMPDYTNTSVIHNYNIPWNANSLKFTAWSLYISKCDGTMNVVDEVPLHANTPHSMKITISNMKENGVARLKNTGYWGVPVRNGEKYKLRFYLRAEDYSGKAIAKVVNSKGIDIATHEFGVVANGEWKEYTADLLSGETSGDATFQLEFTTNGKVWVDYVSLFPENTFKKRVNGMRADIAQKLADLKPAFMRWPGGCVVEGMTIENRIKWKETLGDPMTRRGEYMRWGYRATLGFGYHEFLQYCEDIDAAGMFVANVGVSCRFNNGDYISESVLPDFIQDIRDAIEYAIGDVNSEWGAKRVAAGHPSPFPLKYVELGNENWGPIYIKYYNQCYKVLKAEYPDITFISTLGIEPDADRLPGVDMVDPHYYKTTDFFYDSSFLYDGVQRGKYDIYVGEYACNQGVGAGNMDAALSEAAFMSGMERNADLIKMTSYAPLIENSNRRNWSTNMIWLNSEKVMGRSSYYVQKMYSNNLPDYNLTTRLIPQNQEPIAQGRIGLGTWLTTAQFKDFKVTNSDGSEIFYEGDFVGKQTDWKPFGGTWNFVDGVYQETASAKRCISMMDKWMFNDCVVQVKAKKLSGSEGFLIVFGGGQNDLDSHYQLNIGGWNNTKTGIEKVNKGMGSTISLPVAYQVENNRWYDIKLVISDGYKFDCYIDGEYVVGYHQNITGQLQAISGYDTKTGETVIKVVNGLGTAQNVNIFLNAENISNKGKAITLSASSLTAENSFNNPELISPVETEYSGFSNNFTYAFKPYSFTILRVKSNGTSNTEMVIPSSYSDKPIPVLPTGIENSSEDADLSLLISGKNEWMLSTTLQEIKSLTLIDTNGKIQFCKNSIDTRNYNINLNGYSSGVYLLEIVTSRGIKTVKKIIKI